MWPFSPSLPTGVSKVSKGVYSIDPDIAYPEWLDMLGLEHNLYGIEVAKKCIVKHLQEIVTGHISVQIKYTPHWNFKSTQENELNNAVADSLIHWNKLKKNKLI